MESNLPLYLAQLCDKAFRVVYLNHEHKGLDCAYCREHYNRKEQNVVREK